MNTDLFSRIACFSGSVLAFVSLFSLLIDHAIMFAPGFWYYIVGIVMLFFCGVLVVGFYKELKG